MLVIGDSILKEVGHIRNAIVRSFRGDTLEDLNNHLQEDKEKLLVGKSIVLIHAGTNDLYSLTIEEMLEDLERLVNTIVDHPHGKCKYVAVSSIIPRAKDYWTTLLKIKRYNKEVHWNEDIFGMHYMRTWRPFTRKNLPRKFLYKFDGLHPSRKGADRLSQYLAKQLAITRKELSMPRNPLAASKTVVTKKPGGGLWLQR